MVNVNKLLIKQIWHIYRRQGAIALFSYLLISFNSIINRHFRGSFSQKGEDLIIDRYFNHKIKGFYIDVGACHPKRLSNTKYFYDKGWNGINIEPNPTRIKLFLQDRKRDINLNIGIGTEVKTAVFYEFEATGLSTFSKKEMEALLKIGYKLIKTKKISMRRLEDIMRKHVKSGIDFMTVDAEGMDLEVLKSNNWGKYRPKFLCIETIDFVGLLLNKNESSNRKELIGNYLLGKDYREYYNNGLNTLYEDIR